MRPQAKYVQLTAHFFFYDEWHDLKTYSKSSKLPAYAHLLALPIVYVRYMQQLCFPGRRQDVHIIWRNAAYMSHTTCILHIQCRKLRCTRRVGGLCQILQNVIALFGSAADGSARFYGSTSRQKRFDVIDIIVMLLFYFERVYLHFFIFQSCSQGKFLEKQ